MLQRIVSGGQTGADRAALDAALEQDFPCGGWCPRGRQAEDGPIPARYPMKELSGGYAARTRANVDAADGTVIFHRGQISGGTRLTLEHCRARRAPCLSVDSETQTVQQAVDALAGFVDSHELASLNVAGPRASHDGSIYAYVRAVITALLSRVDQPGKR